MFVFLVSILDGVLIYALAALVIAEVDAEMGEVCGIVGW